MRKSIKYLLVFVSLLVLTSTMALTAGNVEFTFTNTTTTNWGTSGETIAEGNKWDVRIDSISNNGVGRVFAYPSYDWGSGLIYRGGEKA